MEDDILCTALACRPFRDAVFARLPKHDGKPRMQTGVAAVASSVARIEWVMSLPDGGPVWLQNWDWGTSEIIASLGMLDTLQWATDNGCEWPRDVGSPIGSLRGIARAISRPF